MSITLSLIVPVYNRPQEVEELLDSLCHQEDDRFELILVEDGSVERCETIAERYRDHLDIQYFFKTNSGPGLSRNYGAERAKGDYLIFLDSDCIIPPHYVRVLQEFLTAREVSAFGGPDRAHAHFTKVQKAINYSMTSLLTTGGIRGGGKSMEKFHPRSFNMGLSRAAYQKTGGFSDMRFGEDIDLSIRLFRAGFRPVLIPDAFVFHKRRSTFRQFFKQVFNSGIARINLYKRHPGALRAVHFLPALFTLGLVLALALVLAGIPQFLYIYLGYFLLLALHATFVNASVAVGLLAVLSSALQLSAYGLGFLLSFYRRIVRGKGEFARFTRNFYK